ncbi:MAG: methyltransferase domain-containing protein [candidate division WOR-3 bacterium]
MTTQPLNRSRLTSWLIRLGKLDFEDFLLLEPFTVRQILSDPSTHEDLGLALNNAPHIELHLRRSCPDLFRTHPSPFKTSRLTLHAIHDAQARLIRRFAPELLCAKAPPLYDALPWHDWEFTIVRKQVRVWQTRFLLAGAGTTVVVTRLRRSAGVYVIEPLQALCRYIREKGRKEKVKRLSVITGTVDNIPLPPGSADLAIIGGGFGPNPETALSELNRVAARILLVDCDPWHQMPEENWLKEHGFREDKVKVQGLGLRRCWWQGGPDR